MLNSSESSNNKTILVIEDEDQYINQITSFLKNTPYNVLIFDLNIENNVINYINSNKIDLALVDITLINGYNGREIIKQIKDFNDKIKVITLTSLTSGNDMFENLEVGADLHIPKPIKERMLIKNIKLLLD